MRKALVSKLGAERMAQISTTQLLVEIERIVVEKQCDLLNKIKLFEAVQEINEPIRRFASRLLILAYARNFTHRWPSQPCTAAMMKGLANVEIQAELLAEVEHLWR